MLVISTTPWFSSTSGSKSTTAFFEAGFSFLEARLQETLRLLIDLLRMIYFLLNAWVFPAFRKWYFNGIFFSLMLTGHNSVSRGRINLKLTLLPSIVFKPQVQSSFIRNCIGDLRKVCDLAKIGRGRLEIIQGISKSVEAQPRPIWKYRGWFQAFRDLF